VFIGSRRFEVIGVVKNYHYRSLQNELQPLLYIQGHPRNPRYAIKLSGQDIPETISKIESKWKEAYTGNVFRYHFLDDLFDQQYNAERQIGTIVSVLTVLAIFISCSGLFALSLYAVNHRTKEIGIRKVLGATVSSVMFLLSRDFVRLLVIGVIISIPLAYYALKIWLEKYAHKMPVDGWLFITPVAAVGILAGITISIQTIAAARKNPVESMKYE
ncbi:MAG: ABC transporter permease, partial [Marivirga sp.]|nr:ABC transporter permease [Marivirga sp.]